MNRNRALLELAMLALVIHSRSFLLCGDTLDTFFSYHDTKYIIEYSFTTTCSESLLFHICYDYKHLLKFASQEHTTIEKVESHNDWHTLCYQYRYLFYRSHSIYIKRLVLDTKSVTFHMIDFTQNIRIFPHVVKSSGYYAITCDGDERKVTYFQETVLDTKLSGFYLRFVIDKTQYFLKNFESYVKKWEVDTMNRYNTELRGG